MPNTIGTAYVQIIPSAEGASANLANSLGGEAEVAGKKSGGVLGKAMLATAGVAVAAGIGKTISAAVQAGGDLEQSFGGLDTIYGEASESAKEFASQAASMGISANTYAEQAVSMGAALKAAFGGDTEQAINSANTAITDMADNAAKMGTPIESLQTAYQGFAKQNYTMLDNLKLGRLCQIAEYKPRENGETLMCA